MIALAPLPPGKVQPLPPRRPFHRPAVPWRFRGTLADCELRALGRFPTPEQRRQFAAQWSRAQMRAWAMNWRDTWAIAAALGEHPERTARRNLALAVAYREGGDL